jgi:hypothetical protein
LTPRNWQGVKAGLKLTVPWAGGRNTTSATAGGITPLKRKLNKIRIDTIFFICSPILNFMLNPPQESIEDMVRQTRDYGKY